ncbi:MAG: pyridoxal phosphate-dependent aminotransferase [Gammaproteobacteria bacterium]|nr:pyridoxal phosphate-dependent aminotransferase [Gammaproteobacteria bacterium]
MDWPAKRMATQDGKSFGMYETASALAAEGADIIRLEVGRPVMDTPPHIKAAAKQALDDGIVHYGDLQGSRDLREALSEKLARYNHVEFSPDEILITNGLTQASFATFMAGLNEGDEVIVFEPYYPQHNPKIALIGGKVVTVPLDKSANFHLDIAATTAAVTDRTKMIVLINPANPVGTVFTRAELRQLAAIAIENDLLVVTDEVYDFIVYDDAEHVSVASLPGMRERTITLGAFTKAYAMDGWRIGYAAAAPKFIQEIMRVTLNETTHPCVFAQEGAREAAAGPQDCVRDMLAEDQRRRDLVVARLNEMPGIHCHVPEGSMYAFPDFSAYSTDSEEFALTILRDAHVAMEAGAFYGPAGEGHLRICFGAASYARLDEAMDRVQAFLEKRGTG